MLSRVPTCPYSVWSTIRLWFLGVLIGLGYVYADSYGVLLVWCALFLFVGARAPVVVWDPFFLFCGYMQVSIYWVYLSLTWFEASWWDYFLPFLGPGVCGGALAWLVSMVVPWWRLPYGAHCYGFGVWWVLMNVLLSLVHLPWVSVTDLWVGFSLPMVQMVSVIGKDFMDVVLLFCMLMVVHGVWVKSVRIGLLGIALLSALYGWGAWRLQQDHAQCTHASVRLVHTQMSPHARWPEDIEPSAYTLMRVAHNDDERVVATVLPEAFFVAPLENYKHCMCVLHDHQSHHIFVGSIVHEGEKAYNSIVLLDGVRGDRAVYHKRHLVPFGEYIPFSEYISWGVKAIAQGGTEFASGQLSPLFSCGDFCSCRLPAFWSMVCYEGVHAKKGFDVRARWMLQVSNECWFYDSCAREQHWCMLRVRAVEVGRPILRSTNWGISGCIDAYGREKLRYTGKTRVLTQELPPVGQEMTPFVRYQEVLWTLYWVFVGMYVLGLWIYIVRRKYVLGSA